MKSVVRNGWMHAAAAVAMLGVAAAARAAEPAPALSSAKATWHFSFGSLRSGPGGFTNVGPTDIYRGGVGYGFEPGAEVAQNPWGVSSDKPFYFSVKLPEGNYMVTVRLGDPSAASDTTVKAELRRLMLWNIHTAAGASQTRTFTVNIRTPEYPGGQVRLKSPREVHQEAFNWDDKLELEFDGNPASVQKILVGPVNCPTIFLLGDSTVCDQPAEPYTSWGQMLPLFFKPGIAVANDAESGETARSSLAAHRLDKVLSRMKPGDFLLIQFGHNDMKEKGPGVGAYTSYTAELKQYIDGARSKHGIPVLVTSMNRRTYDASGHISNSLKDYPDAVRKLAAAEDVPLIDLNAMSKTLYEAIGRHDLPMAFAPGDGTHHDAYGAYELAKCVVLGIEQSKLDVPKAFIVDGFSFDPARPDPMADIHFAPSPTGPSTRPAGS